MSKYAKMSLTQLQAEASRIETAMAAAKAKELVALHDAIKETCESAGFSVAEVMGTGKRKNKPRKPPIVNPANPKQTWSGLGRPPEWVKQMNGASA